MIVAVHLNRNETVDVIDTVAGPRPCGPGRPRPPDRPASARHRRCYSARYLPVASFWTSALTSATAALDAGVLRAIERRLRPPRRTLPDDARPRLLELAAAYGDDRLFQRGPEPGPVTARRRGAGPEGSTRWDLTLASDYRPLLATYRDEHARYRENHTIHARHYTLPPVGAADAGPDLAGADRAAYHPSGRPVIIALHGWGAGPYWMSERVLGVAGWLRGGVEVVAMQLPLHGKRAPAGRGPSGALVLGPHLARTNEVMGQAISDARALAAHLRGHGAPSVAVVGMSLGGYLASLWARLDPDLAFAVALVPAVDLGELIWGGGSNIDFQRDALRAGVDGDLVGRVFAGHSPLAAPVRLRPDQLAVLAGEGDRITGPAQADRLAAHWGVVAHRFAGGHLAQAGRDTALRAVRRGLREAGHLPARAAAAIATAEPEPSASASTGTSTDAEPVVLHGPR